jgi:putative ABC transport system ATP-binding protein
MGSASSNDNPGGGSAPAPAIEVRDLEFGWSNSVTLLSIHAFDVAPRERVLLHGPSGSGKSTLLGLIGGVLEARKGSVRVLGWDLGTLSGSQRDAFRAEHVGFIFQMFNLIPYLSMLENVLLPALFSRARRARIAGAAARAEGRRLLRALGLASESLLNRPVTQLSIGQQQRVAAARALLGRPDLIVADEPTSALDFDTRAGFLELLMRECASAGTTLLFVSHDTSLRPLFDRSVALREINAASAEEVH